MAAINDVHQTASALVELGKHYISTQRTFTPEIHYWGPKGHAIVLDASPESTLKLAAQVRYRTGCEQTVVLLRTRNPARLVVAVCDGDQHYSWQTPYHFDENERAVFEDTFKDEEEFCSGGVHLERNA